jgi:DNA adenine methylase
MEYINSRLYGSLDPASLESRFETRHFVEAHFLKGRKILSHQMVGPIPYVGGKNRVAKQIIELFPPHTTYVEAFAGGAQVFFHREPSAVEVLNDLDGEIVNFFRICQSHYEELLRYLNFTVVSRKWFELFKAQDPRNLTDVQRAARLLYLQKNAFGGLIRNPAYHYCVVQPPNFNPDSLPELIHNTHKRLARVQIESLPYEEVLKRYDRPHTFFYLDPPYWDRKLYRFNFTEEDFVKLEERLRQIRGKFILSLNDLPEVRKCFHRFAMREIAFAYSSQQMAGKRYPELLISNFPLKPKRP